MTTRKTFTIGQVWPEFVKRLPRTQPRYRIELGPNPFEAEMQSGLADLQARVFQAQQINAQQYATHLFNPQVGVPLGAIMSEITSGWPWN